MKSFALLSLLVVSAAAADSASPLIPSGISSDCQAFLQALDKDTQLQGCITTFTTATSSFTATSTPSKDDVTKAVSSICSNAQSTCSSSFIRSQLTNFYSKCQSELSSDNTVKTLYDYLYVMGPLQEALCAKDTSGESCVSTVFSSSNTGTSLLSGLLATAKQYLITSVSIPKRAEGGNTFQAVNSTTIANTNLLFMFISPDSPTSLLCSTCAQSIMKAYTSMETALPYATGIQQSALLSQQKPLWTAMTNNCNQGAIANAGASPSTPGSPASLGGSISGARSTATVSAGLLGVFAVASVFATL